METGKKMYKVITAMEKRTGGTYWLRVGSAFTNRDNSINLYLDAIPPPTEKSRRYEFQIRELDAEDLRRREGSSTNGSSSRFGTGHGGSVDDNAVAADRLVVRDLGGIGGGPATRAVTTGSGLDSDNIPF